MSVPPALVLLALLAVGIPSALHAALGRPRLQLVATVASAVGVVVAQAVGELLRLSVGLVGDAHVGLAVAASLAASAVVAIVEGPAPAAEPRR